MTAPNQKNDSAVNIEQDKNKQESVLLTGHVTCHVTLSEKKLFEELVKAFSNILPMQVNFVLLFPSSLVWDDRPSLYIL